MEDKQQEVAGLPKGYTSSSMANLHLKFMEYDEDNYGLLVYHEAVTLFMSKCMLGSMDIVDCGISKTSNFQPPQFTLKVEFYNRLLRHVQKLQFYLNEAAFLITHRSSVFQVDPQNTLCPILKGAYDLGQVTAAWSALR